MCFYLLLLVGATRRANRARLVRDRELGAHFLGEGAGFGGAVLPLQPGRLRFADYGRSGSDHVASAFKLRRRAGGCAAGRGLEQHLRRTLLIRSVGTRSIRCDRQPKRRYLSQQNRQCQRWTGGVLRGRSPAAGPVCDAAGRGAVFDLPGGTRRERDVSAHRRNGADSQAELGAARILRAFLPAGADSDGFSFGAQLRRVAAQHRRECLCAHTLRARRGAPIRHRDSVPGMDAERGYI